MPQLINSSEVVEDVWIRLADDQAIGDHKNVIVSLGRLKRQQDDLTSLPLKLGVEIEPDVDVEDIVVFLDHLQLIVLQFKIFSDGRAFSQARLLRDRYTFCGDIRAVGDVICDQLWFMKRSGFNQFELAKGEDLDLAFQTFDQISITYQVELNQSVAR